MKINQATYNDGGEQWTAVPTKTWRKIMAVVRAAEEIEKCNDGPILMSRVDIEGEARGALDALRKHLAKK